MSKPTYEYKTVEALSATRAGRRGRRVQDKLLNKMAASGWELVDADGVGTWDFGSKDTLTFRRPKRQASTRQEPPQQADPQPPAPPTGQAPRPAQDAGTDPEGDQSETDYKNDPYAEVRKHKWVLIAVGVVLLAIVGSLVNSGGDDDTAAIAEMDTVVVPDVQGMGLASASGALEDRDLTIEARDVASNIRASVGTGNWEIVGQDPAAGEQVPTGSTVELDARRIGSRPDSASSSDKPASEPSPTSTEEPGEETEESSFDEDEWYAILDSDRGMYESVSSELVGETMGNSILTALVASESNEGRAAAICWAALEAGRDWRMEVLARDASVLAKTAHDANGDLICRGASVGD